MSKLANQRFSQTFEQKRTALVPYVTAGFPLPDTTLTLMHALVASGADIIELGVPFSDPAADGTVIQKAGEHALERGMNLRKVLEIVREFRVTNAVTPVVLMGYANPIERMGRDLFVTLAAEAGVDGVLVVDYPPEESTDFSELLEMNGMAQIFLLAPTSTPERMKNVAQMAKGYVYYVSLNGVTGAGHLDTAAVASKLNEIRQYLSIPIGVGFGIRNAQSAKAVAACADAVVIGSKILQLMQESIEQQPEERWTECATKAAAEWLQTIRIAMDE